MHLSYRNRTYNGNMSARMRPNSLLLPLLTLGALVMQFIDPSKVWQAMVVALGGTWLIGWLWARSLRNHLRLTREVRFTWAQVGDKLEEQFTLTNDGLTPATWVEVVDHSTLPDYSAGRAIGIGNNESNTWHTNGVCTQRGVYTLGGTTLRSGDPLGIFNVEVHQPESTDLTVLPPVVPLPMVEITPGGWLGDGRPRPNSPEKTVNALTVHEYQHGEPVKLIHWATTARRNQIFTRVMDGSPANDWWIVLDADANAQAGHGWESTLELGIILATSLVDRGLRARHSVGFLASGDQTVWLKPEQNENHRSQIMRGLATLKAGNLPLSDLLERAGPTLGQRTSIIVITPCIASDWLTPLTHLIWRGISPTVLLMDPASFGSPNRADALAQVLARNGIPRFVLDKSLLLRPEARPGWRGQWEWRIMPTGKAVSARPPGDMSWRKLG
ncbi:MAG: DUF58 domain-containing protein [Chloroflexi bacterium]|nr:DUF58 domain-containing protein [Chloroflexota bacterium]